MFRRSGRPDPFDWPAFLAARARSARHPALRECYAAGTVAAETSLADTPLIAIDLETTGLDPDRHAIVSIGLVPFTIDRIVCRHARYWAVRPRRNLEGKSVTIHRITHDQLENAPDFSGVMAELLAMITGRVGVVHYRAIERNFLDGAFRERIGEGLQFPLIDTMELEARAHRWRSPGLLAYLLGRRLVSLRLAECRRRYNLPPYSPHHALTDALATAELFQAQVAHRFGPDTPVGELWC